MFRFTIRDVLWLTVVVAVALTMYVVKPHQARPQWEYRMNYNLGDVGALDAEGDKGWELVLIDGPPGGNRVFYFKRPKQN
jgi:hypothetical protein